MKTFYIYYWTIGGSKASCGLEPVRIRAKLKAENEQKAKERFFARHDDLEDVNIIKIEEMK